MFACMPCIAHNAKLLHNLLVTFNLKLADIASLEHPLRVLVHVPRRSHIRLSDRQILFERLHALALFELAEQLLLGDLALPLDGQAVPAESDLEAAHADGAVEAVLRVLLPAPDHLHGPLQRLGDRHRLRDEIPLAAPPEAPEDRTEFYL